LSSEGADISYGNGEAFRGMVSDSRSAYAWLDGNTHDRFWWFSVGTVMLNDGGIPAYPVVAAKVAELYIIFES
jgi:hypothetical protein